MSEPLGFYDSGDSGAAALLARMVRDRVPGWIETSKEAGHWRFTDPDPDQQGRYVEIEGRDRIVPVIADPMDGKHVGPSALGYCNEVTVVVTLPHVSDKSDQLAALSAVEAFGALPEATSS